MTSDQRQFSQFRPMGQQPTNNQPRLEPPKFQALTATARFRDKQTSNMMQSRYMNPPERKHRSRINSRNNQIRYQYDFKVTRNLAKVSATKEEYRDQLLESVEIARKTGNNKIRKVAVKSKEKYDETAVKTKFQKGDKVMLSKKSKTEGVENNGPFIHRDQVSPHSLELKTIHVNRMKKETDRASFKVQDNISRDESEEEILRQKDEPENIKFVDEKEMNQVTVEEEKIKSEVYSFSSKSIMLPIFLSMLALISTISLGPICDCSGVNSTRIIKFPPINDKKSILLLVAAFVYKAVKLDVFPKIEKWIKKKRAKSKDEQKTDQIEMTELEANTNIQKGRNIEIYATQHDNNTFEPPHYSTVQPTDYRQNETPKSVYPWLRTWLSKDEETPTNETKF